MKGNNLSPPSMCNNPCIIAFLGTRSKAPHRPQREDGGRLVQFCHRLEGMGNALAPCPRAYWNGAVATSPALANCCANVRATNRRNTSLTTIPKCPQMVSSGLSCVPNAMPATQFQGLPHVRRTQPLHTKSPTCGLTPREGTKVPQSSLTDLEPRLGVQTRRSWRIISSSNWMRSFGCKRIRFGGTASRGLAGRLSGFVNSANVATVPGAISAPSRACRAADNSPRDECVRLVTWVASSPACGTCCSITGDFVALCKQ